MCEVFAFYKETAFRTTFSLFYMQDNSTIAVAAQLYYESTLKSQN